MAITYDVANNKIVVTGYTAETPCTFADVHDADLAGEFELLAATGPAADITLDNQVRPAALLALKITFTLAGTNAGAGDTLDLTGTNAWGDAQTESIDVSGGNDDYTTAKYWQTITDIDCIGFSDAVGTVAAKQGQWGVIEERVEDAVYYIAAAIDFGNGSTTTYFESVKEAVYFADSCYPSTKNYAYLYVGEADGDYSGYGSYWSFQTDLSAALRWSQGTNARPYVYGSLLCVRERPGEYSWLSGGLAYFYDSKIDGGGWQAWRDPSYWRNVYIYKPKLVEFNATPTVDDIQVHEPTDFAIGAAFGTYTIDDVLCTGAIQQMRVARGTLICKDARAPIGTPYFVKETDILKEIYTCNIHVAYKDGTDAVGVTVLCEDQFGTQVFTDTTDAGGDISEQIIEYRRYYYDGGIQVRDYSPHIFTLSKTGQPSVVLESITVDHPIIWRLELPDVPAEVDTRLGTTYADGSMTGALNVTYGTGGIAANVSQRSVSATVTQHSVKAVVD